MKRLPFRYLEPVPYAGLLDDPLLLVRVRPSGESLLFDCGQLHHLAKRTLKGIRAVFVSHAHMDHFMGLDTLIRHNHVSPKTIEIFGPPGIAGKVAAKLAGYDWNLTEPYWCTLLVHEVHADRLISFRFPGSEGFPALPHGEVPRRERTIYRNEFLQVEGELLDHKLPVLACRISERESFLVDTAKIATEGLLPGEWLRILKKRFYAGELAAPLRVLTPDGEAEVADAGKLFDRIRLAHTPATIGYLTDIGLSPENLAKAESLLTGVTLLACECSFLAADEEKARLSRHLCTSDLNLLLERLKPAFILPLHLSKSYIHRWDAVYQELVLPKGTRLIRLPPHVTPRPLLPCEMPRLAESD